MLLGGGLLRGGDEHLLSAIVAGLAEVGAGVIVRTTDTPPVVGAALLGLDRLGADPEAKERAKRELAAAADGDDDLNESDRSLGVEAHRG